MAGKLTAGQARRLYEVSEARSREAKEILGMLVSFTEDERQMSLILKALRTLGSRPLAEFAPDLAEK